MRVLYLDCFSGISGDMTVAALVDAGADRDYIEGELAKIKLEPYTLTWKRVVKCGVSSLKFNVELDPEHPPVHHRHYSEIVKLISQAGFNDRVASMSLALFEVIGQAEAKIHNIPLDKVHFHEVGAIDSIVDIIAASLALDSLKIDRIFVSPVPLGSGTVKCGHGFYPIPAPATLEIMKGVPIAPTEHRKEMTTPTGAAIVSVLAHDFMEGLPPMVVEAIGYGAGTRDFPQQPNVLRAVIGRMENKTSGLFPLAQNPGHHHHGHHHHHHDHDHDHGHEHGHDHHDH